MHVMWFKCDTLLNLYFAILRFSLLHSMKLVKLQTHKLKDFQPSEISET